jgi:DNA repair exonuclease SbcCD ATPase subunit
MESMTAFEQIRRDLNEMPSDLVKWEAACLKDMANLLDSLERARSEWQSLSAQLTDAQKVLAQESRTREELDRVCGRLAAAEREIEAGRDLGARVAFAEGAAAAALERLAESEQTLAEASACAATSGAELARVRERLATAQRERDVLAENEQDCAELKAEAADLRGRLRRAERAQAELREERDRAASLERELDRTRELLQAAEGEGARRAALERALAEAKAEAEAQMVLACDLHVRVNRLEKERDEALAYGRRKLKKVIEKVHEALDATGAPRGADLSYGDRIRWLVTRLEERGGTPP